jgi:hypothetical protein
MTNNDKEERRAMLWTNEEYVHALNDLDWFWNFKMPCEFTDLPPAPKHTDEEYDRQVKAKYDAENRLRICQDMNWKMKARIKELEADLDLARKSYVRLNEALEKAGMKAIFHDGWFDVLEARK